MAAFPVGFTAPHATPAGASAATPANTASEAAADPEQAARTPTPGPAVIIASRAKKLATPPTSHAAVTRATTAPGPPSYTVAANTAAATASRSHVAAAPPDHHGRSPSGMTAKLPSYDEAVWSVYQRTRTHPAMHPAMHPASRELLPMAHPQPQHQTAVPAAVPLSAISSIALGSETPLCQQFEPMALSPSPYQSDSGDSCQDEENCGEDDVDEGRIGDNYDVSTITGSHGQVSQNTLAAPYVAPNSSLTLLRKSALPRDVDHGQFAGGLKRLRRGSRQHLETERTPLRSHHQLEGLAPTGTIIDTEMPGSWGPVPDEEAPQMPDSHAFSSAITGTNAHGNDDFSAEEAPESLPDPRHQSGTLIADNFPALVPSTTSSLSVEYPAFVSEKPTSQKITPSTLAASVSSTPAWAHPPGPATGPHLRPLASLTITRPQPVPFATFADASVNTTLLVSPASLRPPGMGSDEGSSVLSDSLNGHDRSTERTELLYRLEAYAHSHELAEAIVRALDVLISRTGHPASDSPNISFIQIVIDALQMQQQFGMPSTPPSVRTPRATTPRSRLVPTTKTHSAPSSPTLEMIATETVSAHQPQQNSPAPSSNDIPGLILLQPPESTITRRPRGRPPRHSYVPQAERINPAENHKLQQTLSGGVFMNFRLRPNLHGGPR